MSSDKPDPTTYFQFVKQRHAYLSTYIRIPTKVQTYIHKNACMYYNSKTVLKTTCLQKPLQAGLC